MIASPTAGSDAFGPTDRRDPQPVEETGCRNAFRVAQTTVNLLDIDRRRVWHVSVLTKRREPLDSSSAPAEHIDQDGGIEQDAHTLGPAERALTDAPEVGSALFTHPPSRIAVPIMLGVGERAYGVFDVLPATLVVEGAPNRRSDERAALTPTHPAVESTHELVVQAYVQTHGHTLAHAVQCERLSTLA